ncbi:MAG: hypothetical protein VZQ98_06235 [Bacteroidales bacterium]|nr:hypothetical protein [Bacteroidales bacterium]
MRDCRFKIVVLCVCMLLPSLNWAGDFGSAFSRYYPFSSQTVEGWNYIREHYSEFQLPSPEIVVPEEIEEKKDSVEFVSIMSEETEYLTIEVGEYMPTEDMTDEEPEKKEPVKEPEEPVVETSEIKTDSLSAYLRYEVDSLTKVIDSYDRKKLSFFIVPYWMSDVYKHLDRHSNTYLDNHESYLGYVVDPMTGGSLVETNFRTYINDTTQKWEEKEQTELLVMFSGDLYTEQFLLSDSSQKRLILNLFGDSLSVLRHEHVSGVNFYFPDYRFDRPREMAKFVKTISLVVDSLVDKADGCYVYGAKEPSHKNLDLNLMFNYEEKTKHYNYISGLQCFVDAIYFADFDEFGLPVRMIKDNGSVDTASILSRIINPFYLFHFKTNEVDESSRTEIKKLIMCDYNSGMCGLFLIIEIVLFLLIIVYLFLCFTSTEMNLWKSVYPTLFVLVPIMLVSEFIVFFFCFIEALSPQIIFVKIENSYTEVFKLMFLPIIPIVIYLVYQRVKANSILP